MNPYIIITAALIISGAMYIIIPRMVKKYSAGAADEQSARYLESIGNNAEQERVHALEDPAAFKPVKDSLPAEKITGITSCMEKRDFSDVAYQAMIKTISKSMGSGYRQVDNYDAYFLVLTDKQLHYFAFDNKQCETHLCFPLNDIQQLKIAETNISDNLAGGNMVGKKLSFTSGGQLHKFYYFETIVKTPDNRWFSFLDSTANRERIRLTALFAKPFTEAIYKMAH